MSGLVSCRNALTSFRWLWSLITFIVATLVVFAGAWPVAPTSSASGGVACSSGLATGTGTGAGGCVCLACALLMVDSIVSWVRAGAWYVSAFLFAVTFLRLDIATLLASAVVSSSSHVEGRVPAWIGIWFVGFGGA